MPVMSSAIFSFGKFLNCSVNYRSIRRAEVYWYINNNICSSNVSFINSLSHCERNILLLWRCFLSFRLLIFQVLKMMKFSFHFKFISTIINIILSTLYKTKIILKVHTHLKQTNYFSATYWAIINATVWEFPKRENGGTHDRHKGLFCALANWPLPCKDAHSIEFIKFVYCILTLGYRFYQRRSGSFYSSHRYSVCYKSGENFNKYFVYYMSGENFNEHSICYKSIFCLLKVRWKF